MKLFKHHELKDAYLFAEDGGQALLIAKKRKVAFLIDHDTGRLYSTARNLGVRSVEIQRGNMAGQQLELEGRPFDRAVNDCSALELDLR